MILKHRILDLLFIGIFFSIPSCADSINDLSTEIYSIDGFSSSALSRDGVAITPTVPGEGSKDEAKLVTGILNKLIVTKIQSSHVVGSKEIEQRVEKDKTLGGLWSRIEPHISVHSVKGLDLTGPFGKSLGVRFLLESQIQMAEEAGGAEQVRIFARIYDVVKGRIVWEGVGEGRGYVKLFFPSAPATFKETATVAVRGLISRIFSD
jgi:hypothetical protein